MHGNISTFAGSLCIETTSWSLRFRILPPGTIQIPEGSRPRVFACQAYAQVKGAPLFLVSPIARSTLPCYMSGATRNTEAAGARACVRMYQDVRECVLLYIVPDSEMRPLSMSSGMAATTR
jgi:hypothetical protein